MLCDNLESVALRNVAGGTRIMCKVTTSRQLYYFWTHLRMASGADYKGRADGRDAIPVVLLRVLDRKQVNRLIHELGKEGQVRIPGHGRGARYIYTGALEESQ